MVGVMDKSAMDKIFELAASYRDQRTAARLHRRQAAQRDEASKRLEALRVANAARLKELIR